VLKLIEAFERAKQISEHLVTVPRKDTFSSKEKELLKSNKFIIALNETIQYFDEHGFEDKAS